MAKVRVARPKVAVRKAGLREEAEHGGAIGGGADVVAGAALGFAANPAVEGGNDEAGNGADKERRAPAPVRADLPAGQIAQRRAHGNGQIKDGEDAVAIALGIEVGQHGGGEDAEGGLADADQRVADVEGPVAVDPGRAERGQAPQDRAGDDERLAAEAVAQPAGERRGEHVEDEQRGGERAHLLVGGVKLALDQRDFAGQNVAVNVVEEVEADEQQQRPQGGAEAGAERLG